jgi:hypothetical protein
MGQAPANIIAYAKQQCNKAIPTVIAKNDQDQWCVLCWYADEREQYIPKIELTQTTSGSELPKA